MTEEDSEYVVRALRPKPDPPKRRNMDYKNKMKSRKQRSAYSQRRTKLKQLRNMTMNEAITDLERGERLSLKDSDGARIDRLIRKLKLKDQRGEKRILKFMDRIRRGLGCIYIQRHKW